MVEISLEHSVGAGPPALPRRWSFDWLTVVALRVYNGLQRLFFPPEPVVAAASRELTEIRRLAAVPSDIDEHLEFMFAEAMLLRPKLIVELGVRGGTSTFVFERAASLCGASIISVDIDDCSGSSQHPRWHFFQGDDVEFAGMFSEFCARCNLTPSIDLLFIDTSHYYRHTVHEIAAWFPFLSPHAKVMFHDTNMRLTGRRLDGCFQPSWQNERGVIRAIEEYLGIKIDESKNCVECVDGWVVRHRANCNGFTVLDKVKDQTSTSALQL